MTGLSFSAVWHTYPRTIRSSTLQRVRLTARSWSENLQLKFSLKSVLLFIYFQLQFHQKVSIFKGSSISMSGSGIFVSQILKDFVCSRLWMLGMCKKASENLDEIVESCIRKNTNKKSNSRQFS